MFREKFWALLYYTNFRDYARKLNIKIPEETAAEMSSDLYDNDTVFQFCQIE